MVGRHLGDVDQTLDAFADLHESAERHQLGDPAVHQLAHAVGAGELLPRILLRGLERQADALAVVVDVEHLHRDLVAHRHDRTGVVDVLPGELADVDETVHAAEVDERTEGHHARHDALADLARLQVGEEVLALLLLRLLEVATAGQDHVVAVLVELDDLGLQQPADVGLQVAHTAQLDERCREEATQTDVHDEAALDDLDHHALDDAVGFLHLLDRAPRPLVLRALLGQDEAPFLVLLGEDEGFDRLTQLHDLVRVDVVADRQLAAGDDALGLVADVEEDFVLVDLHDRAVHDLAILDIDHRSRDGIGEGLAEIVGDDLAGGVGAVLVERSKRGGNGGLGQGRSGFQKVDGGLLDNPSDRGWARQR